MSQREGCSHPRGAAHGVVFVVDDDVSVREALHGLLTYAGWTCETFASGTEFLDHRRPAVPSCLVLDVNLPDLSGLDLQERVGSHRSELPIIFITGFGDIPSTVRAMKAGAAEFLTKPFSDEVLLAAIGSAIELSARAIGDQAERDRVRAAHSSLSPREREVMALVVAGHLNKQVAAELGISEITVKAHRGRVMRKMGATSLAHLVNLARQLGLSPL